MACTRGCSSEHQMQLQPYLLRAAMLLLQLGDSFLRLRWVALQQMLLRSLLVRLEPERAVRQSSRKQQPPDLRWAPRLPHPSARPLPVPHPAPLPLQ